ncbi:MAG: hypothetical protein R2705_17335 [Ilumatobacteraceae bacterium]
MVFGSIAVIVNELFRRRRLARRARFVEDSVPTTVVVRAIESRAPRVSCGVRRAVPDDDGIDRSALVTVRAVEAGAIRRTPAPGSRQRYRPDAPHEVLLDRPPIADDRAWVSAVAGLVTLLAFSAAGTFV